MPRSPKHAEVEQRIRALLDDAGLPEPDETTHWRHAVVFYWHATKAIVLIDLDEVVVDDLHDLDLDELVNRPPWEEGLLPGGWPEAA